MNEQAAEDWTVEFRLPSALLPSVDLDSAPPEATNSEPEKAAAEPATAEPRLESAEVSAIEAVIAQAFPELQSDTEPAAETTASDAETAPAAETPPPPSVQDAAPQPELAAATAPEDETAPEADADLPSVDLDTEFDTEEFLFGEEDSADASAGPNGQTAEMQAADAPAPSGEAAPGNAAAPATETPPDPLIPIKAMSPEERIALFS